jgi:hypothetical protein
MKVFKIGTAADPDTAPSQRPLHIELSEAKTEGHLDLARISQSPRGRGCNHTEVRRAVRRNRIREIDGVQDVEGLEPEVDGLPITDHETLRQAGVNIECTRSLPTPLLDQEMLVVP